MCLAFCTLEVERGATPALHLMGGGTHGAGLVEVERILKERVGAW